MRRQVDSEIKTVYSHEYVWHWHAEGCRLARANEASRSRVVSYDTYSKRAIN